MLVLGDLVLDVVLAPEQPIEAGTDVPGTVGIRQGGSGANTARWLARLGVETQLVCAVGRDGAGRSLVIQVGNDGVSVRAARVAGQRTGRIGVIVAPNGERSFVADRRAALAKELTKMFESVKRGRLSELLAGLNEKLRGEYVVVIAGTEGERSDKC